MRLKNYLHIALYAVKCVSIFSILFTCILQAVSESIHVPTFHLDGAFQTASGLFRLKAGQVPGENFYTYLGRGPLYVIYPLFLLFGGDLAATVAASKLATVFLSWSAAATLYYLIVRPPTVTASIFGSSILLFGVEFLTGLSSFPSPFTFAFEPGNSLRPIRSSLPYLVALCLCIIIKLDASTAVRVVLISFVLSATFLWSNDFALPTYLLFLIFIFLYFSFTKKNWYLILIIKIISITFGAMLLYLITKGHVYNLISYSFLDVAGDQWWFFGPYGEKFRIFDVKQVYKIFSIDTYFPLFVLLGVLLVAIKTKLIEVWFVFTVGAALFCGGTLASVGGHLGGYFNAFYLWGIITSAMFLIKILNRLIINTKRLSASIPICIDPAVSAQVRLLI